MNSRKNLVCTSHTMKDVAILSEGQLSLIYKEVDMRAKSVVKNLSDYLDDDIEEANRPKVIDQRTPSCFGMRATNA